MALNINPTHWQWWYQRPLTCTVSGLNNTRQIDTLGNNESVLTALIKHSTYNGLENNVKCIYVNTVNEIV